MNGFNMKWMNRKAMIKRGRRMMIAHNRGLIEVGQMAEWFERTLPRYASFGQSIFDTETDLAIVENRFWNECEKWVIEHYYGFSMEDFS
jgi:hypothetical protein